MLHSRLKNVAAAIAILLLSACATTAPKISNDIHSNSVKVTNVKGNHGGTGIVLRSSSTSSLVLTNAHVCGVVENGGIVSGKAGTFLVSGYKKSEQHDLCLIKVSANLGYNTIVASRPPNLYYERASISGHPALYPNVISKGKFSGKDIITILVGVRPCTPEDEQDPNKAMVCMFLGGIPIVKQFQSTLVSATIMPGSSGSGVYNSENELSGVAFAGQGSLGYAWTVPYEDMRNFLDNEQQTLPFKSPPNEVDLFGSQSDGRRATAAFMDRARRVCHTATREKIESVCALADIDILR